MSWSGESWRRFSAERRPSALIAALIACALVATTPALAQRLVFLPMENFGQVPDVADWMTPLVEEEVRARGWDLVSGEAVERSLAAARIRRMDALPAGTRETFLAEFAAGGYVATTILSFTLGEAPVLTMSIRMVDVNGTEQFSEVIGLSTENVRGPLDIQPSNEIEPLVAQVMVKLFQRFPQAGETTRKRKPGRSPAKLHAPFTFLSDQLDSIDAPRRVTVLPLRSFARDRTAARIATRLTERWLERASRLELVNPADLRQALIAEGLRNPSAISPEMRMAVGERLGSRLFLGGTVYRWTPEAPTGSEVRPPEVELNLMMIDATTSRILWSSQHERRGDQYAGLMRLGAVTNVVALADRVIGEMIAAQASARPVSMPPPRSPLAPLLWVFKKEPDDR